MLTITGTGLGQNVAVTVDGQSTPTLPGATDTQVQVLAPVAVLTSPCTYRLTAVDPVRQVGEAFAIASRAASVAAVSLTTSGTGVVPGQSRSNGVASALFSISGRSGIAPLPSTNGGLDTLARQLQDHQTTIADLHAGSLD